MDSPPMRESSLKDSHNKQTDVVKESHLPDSRTSDIPKFSKIQRHMLQRTKSLPPAKARADMNPSTFGTKDKSLSEEFRLTQQNSETQQTSSHILHMKMTTASPESEARGRSVTLKSEPALDNHSGFNSKSLSQSLRVSGEKEDRDKADWSLELDASDGSSESEMSIDGLVEHLLHSSRQRSYASKEDKKDIGAGEDFDEDEIDWLDLTKDFESNLEVWECEICLGSANTMTLCCQFHICDQCMSSYINHKVSEARIQMECPNYNCHVLLPRALIEVSLTPELRINYQKFLADRNEDPHSKTCPGCNAIHSVQPEELERPKRKMHNGLQVCCAQCKLIWCFLCQAPYHNGITCKEYRKGDVMLRKWAKEWSYGQFNAQRCPKCKVYIQKANGCDHVICTQCVTAFCYRCGKRYINTRIFGSHMSRYSVFGCKYRLLPKRPALRRLIRGSCFAALLSGGIILAGLGVVLGAGLLGASVFFLPGYGIFRWRKRVKLKRRHKRFVLRQLREKEARQRWQEELLSKMTGREAALCPLWESETDNLSVEFLDSLEREREGQKGLDTQVHVIVHR
ncbi:E3 ubiquitin-protein ligase arih2 [Plakobranchus ocellatus]|uniref:RBR-type E3 ubiquitin transferase n=1 Tax=Plakobranchus ocellatus TaxID=259542 RepID=A0AAV4CDV7_9GAST|nr:E3 ubiquitin-protein ligase arih2 [Plakobranchus ocellatus]